MLLCGDSGVSSLEDWRCSRGSWSWCVRGCGRQEEKELWAGMGATPCRCAGFRGLRTCRWQFPQRGGAEVGVHTVSVNDAGVSVWSVKGGRGRLGA